MARLDCITKGHRHQVFSLLLSVQVQMHENCMTSQMWINNKEVFFPSSISNMFGMFLRQQTNCWVARSKTFLLLANEVEQDIEEKYTFFIGLLYLINYLVDSFSVLTTSKWSLCKQWNVVCSVCWVLGVLVLFFLYVWVFFLGGQESSIMHIMNKNYKEPTYSDDIPFQYSLYGHTQSYFLVGLMSILVCSSQ